MKCNAVDVVVKLAVLLMCWLIIITRNVREARMFPYQLTKSQPNNSQLLLPFFNSTWFCSRMKRAYLSCTILYWWLRSNHIVIVVRLKAKWCFRYNFMKMWNHVLHVKKCIYFFWSDRLEKAEMSIYLLYPRLFFS